MCVRWFATNKAGVKISKVWVWVGERARLLLRRVSSGRLIWERRRIRSWEMKRNSKTRYLAGIRLSLCWKRRKKNWQRSTMMIRWWEKNFIGSQWRAPKRKCTLISKGSSSSTLSNSDFSDYRIVLFVFFEYLSFVYFLWVDKC